jgi:hypothetical protein
VPAVGADSRRRWKTRAVAATTALVVAACSGSMTLGGITLLRYGPQVGGPTALATGTLRFEAGCTTIDIGDPTHSVILWPMGTSLASVEGQVHVVSDGVTATDGDTISLGGGQYDDQGFVERLVGPVGQCLAESYWLGYDLRRE